MPEKQADADLQLDVDVMILDYLMYMATAVLLKEANAQMQRESHGDVEAESHQCHYPAADRARAEDPDDAVNHPEPDLAISIVDSFLQSFQLRHPSATVAKSLKLRLKLLRLICLFTCRLNRCKSTPSREALESLRQKNRRRAKTFTSSFSAVVTRTSNKRNRDGDLTSTAASASASASATASTSAIIPSLSSAFTHELPIPKESLRHNRESVLKTLLATTSPTSQLLSPLSSPSSSSPSSLSVPLHTSTPSHPAPFYGTPDSVSLLDLLPSFISLSASRAHLGPEAEEFVVQPRWMRLAAEWMLQAVLEQYRIFGAEGPGLVEESFAWGYGYGGEGGSGVNSNTEEDGDAEEHNFDEEEEGLMSAIFARDVDGKNNDGASNGVKLVENELWSRLRQEYMHKVSLPEDMFCSILNIELCAFH